MARSATGPSERRGVPAELHSHGSVICSTERADKLVFGSFTCSGTWSANGFSCTITGEVGSGPNDMCPGVQFRLMTSGVLPNGVTLQPGQIEVFMEGFAALCQ